MSHIFYLLLIRPPLKISLLGQNIKNVYNYDTIFTKVPNINNRQSRVQDLITAELMRGYKNQSEVPKTNAAKKCLTASP